MRCKPRPFARPRRLATLRLGAFPRRVEETWRPLSSIAMLATVVFLFAAPTAQAARSEFFGIAHGPTLDDTDLQTMAATGVKTDRFLLGWKKVQPSSGDFDWGATDQLIGGLASHGIRGAPFVFGSPSWTRTGGTARPPVNTESAKHAWGDFLKAAVSRYGPGGSYWTNGYRQQFGDSAVPLPVRSWQVWNEPNLPQFDPGATVDQAAHRYAQLLRISHDAIRSQDQQAEIVLAGLATADPRAFDFLKRLYSVPEIKGEFDAVAQHPYASGADEVGAAIQQIRDVMASHGDRATPLWITELGWGSAPADGYANLGPEGQASMLTQSFALILANRSAWNVQRLYWFFWRDPEPSSPYVNKCLRCGTAGLLAHDRTPKPAYDAFLAFTTETTPPTASISGGPREGGFTKDPTPRFFFSSSEAGSTFACRIDAGALSPCASPYTAPTLSQGPHGFSVEAIDAAGNESSVVTRSFTVETSAPQTTIDSGPSGATNDPTPTFEFSSSQPRSSFRCKLDSAPSVACHSANTLSHLTDGRHTFSVQATDRVGYTDASPASATFTVRTASISVEHTALVVTAAPGAKDNLDISLPFVSIVRVSDFPSGAYTGSGVHAGAGCSRTGDYTVNCAASLISPVLPARVTSADQDDRVANSSGLPSSLYGNSGDDLLIGGTANDILNGGAGADVMMGMDGNDLLQAHDGASDQTIDCGNGSDKADLDLLSLDPNVKGCETKTRH